MGLFEDLGSILSGDVLRDEPMSKHTTFGVGGPADYYVTVETEDELAALMRYLGDKAVPWMILGDGANMLVSDKGIRGVVIKLEGDFESASVKGHSVAAGSALPISWVADLAAKNGMSGLEGVGIVPGSVGGAVVMNAGTHRGYIDTVVREVSVVDTSGAKHTLSKEECGFSYRNSRFQNDHSLILTFVTFDLKPGDPRQIAEELARVRRHRIENLPQGRSAGGFFKNPPGGSAGRLIEQSDLKGLREGRAVVADRHANFIVNEGGASASEILALADRVKRTILEKHGVDLEYEVRLVGDWS
jgi:UDP-N-acetylmuramate dehydrogenase